MARQANPQLQSPALFSRSARERSPEEILEELKRRALLSRGGFSTFAEETGAEPGFVVPGGVPVASQLGEIAGQTRQTLNVPQPPQYPEIPEFNPVQPDMGQGEQPSQIDQFLNQYIPTVETVAQTQDGGAVLPDGTTVYPDGTMINEWGQLISAVASLPGGYTLYLDGSIRMGGLEELVAGIFGTSRFITQAYGNYNPAIEPGAGYNLGTDIRTRDLQQRGQYLPDDVRVVGVTYDDGTRFGDQSGHQGYGNSVLVQLPTGEMLRFSHLATLPQGIQEGDVIPAGTQFIYPGATGNVTGEHLDLEYYNAQGQIDNPDNFRGFQNVRDGVGRRVPLEQLPPEIQQAARDVYAEPEQNFSYDSTLQQPQQQQPISQPQQTGLLSVARQAREAGQSVIEAISQAPAQVQRFAAQAPEQAAQAAGIEAELGLSEAISQGRGDVGQRSPAMQARVSALGRQPQLNNPYRQLAGNVAERIGDTLGIPEGAFSETIAGGATKRTNQALASEIGDDPRQVPGIRQNLQDIGRDLQSRAGNAIAGIGQGVQGAAQNIQSDISQVTDKIRGFHPGAGIDRLKEGAKDLPASGANVNLFSRRNLESLGQDRVVGDSAGGNLLAASTGARATGRAGQDTSDPFFGSELFKKLSGFLNIPSGEIKDQALTQDVFTGEFYDDPSRVSSVFTGTYMQEPALQRATNQMKQAYRQAYSGDEWDQASVDRILSQLPDTLNYSPNLPEPQRAQPKARPTLQDYLSQGKTVEQYYAETGQQSTLDQMRKQGLDVQTFRGRQLSTNPNVSRREQQQRTAGSPHHASPRSGFEPGYGYSGGGSGGGGGEAWKPEGQEVSATTFMGRQLGQKEDDGLFNRAKRFAGGLFQRFFN